MYTSKTNEKLLTWKLFILKITWKSRLNECILPKQMKNYWVGNSFYLKVSYRGKLNNTLPSSKIIV
jgi:hypothetical protein